MRLTLLGPADHRRADWARAPIERACAAHGIALTMIGWAEALRAPADHPALAGADLVVPLLAWGYDERPADWAALLARAEAERWPLRNAPALMRWNSDKAYLAELAAQGIATVPTRAVAALDAAALAEARAAFGSETLVVKPAVSANARQTYRLGPDEALPADVAGQPMLVQPFLPAIAAEGEWALLLFGGRFSHAVVKRPAPGDFRVQPDHGGTNTPATPPPPAVATAQAVVAACPQPPLYARVDLVRHGDRWLLMEVELIEPALWLDLAPDGGARFAEALKIAADRAAV